MVIHKDTPKTTQFLNVDLDIYSSSNLQPLVTALGDKVFALHVGRHKRTYSANLELAGMPKDADSAIRVFCVLIQALPTAERNLWNAAKRREFNIGVQAERQPYAYEFALAPETLRAASELNAQIVFTVCAPQPRRKDSRKL